MAFIGYDIYWRSEFYNNVSAKDRVQQINLDQLKVKVNDTFKKHGKIATNYEPSNDEDVINKADLDKKLSNKDGHISYKQECYIKIKFLCNKQSEEEVLIERAVKTAIPKLYYIQIFDQYKNAEEKKIFFRETYT